MAGDVNIYAHDAYPLDYTCDNAGIWSSGSVSSILYTVHEEQSPRTPYTIAEFAGGGGDGWGGFGFDVCEKKLNHEFERVFYKNNFANGIKIMNLYTICEYFFFFGSTTLVVLTNADGGTNWGNIGYPGK
jgi:hypothetical protein